MNFGSFSIVVVGGTLLKNYELMKISISNLLNELFTISQLLSDILDKHPAHLIDILFKEGAF